MRSISTVQRPMPRTSVRLSMIAWSAMRWTSASGGIEPRSVRCARSRRDRTLERESPAERSFSSDARRIWRGVGPLVALGKSAQRRAKMVAAALPVSCW